MDPISSRLQFRSLHDRNCTLLTDFGPSFSRFFFEFPSKFAVALGLVCEMSSKNKQIYKGKFSLFNDINSFSCSQSHGEISPPGSRRTMMSLQVRFWGKEKPTSPPDTLQRLSHTLLPLLSMPLKEGGENSRMSVNATSSNMGTNPNNIPRRNAPWLHFLVLWDEHGQSNIICLLLLKLSPWCHIIYVNNSMIYSQATRCPLNHLWTSYDCPKMWPKLTGSCEVLCWQYDWHPG